MTVRAYTSCYLEVKAMCARRKETFLFGAVFEAKCTCSPPSYLADFLAGHRPKAHTEALGKNLMAFITAAATYILSGNIDMHAQTTLV